MDQMASPAFVPTNRLSPAVLARLPDGIMRPAYDRHAVSPGIVHLGLGAFARSHLAVFTDDILAAGDLGWGIVGGSLHSPEAYCALVPQGGLYTLVVRGPDDDRLRVIGALAEVLASHRDPAATLARLADPRTRIVTLTVTEKGYCQDAASGTLDEDHPAIVADLAPDVLPRSVPGLLTAAIRRRRDAGLPPFTVLVCDNLPQNGATVRNIVTRFALLQDPALGRFIEDTICFPNTMVDRITPATQDLDRATIAVRMGVEDAWPVICEPFRQWVIEDHFGAGRPRWEDVGATLVRDVAPFETMKLRCLNGSHSAMAYIGVVAGLETIAAAFGDPAVARFISGLWHEDLVPTVPPVPGIDVKAYTAELAARYRNPRIRHRTQQIASDGSQKLPPRLLEPALARLRAGGSARHIAFVVAAWMRFTLGETDKGERYAVNDPLAARLTAIAGCCGRNAARLAAELFGITEIFTPALLAEAGFRAQVVADLEQILAIGVAPALLACSDHSSRAAL
ncbi:MAG: mannitol dehydrogenase family protein [Azospirillaceae bacterium]|nr:mannitol dehydrogenase family protein [Azospirillaceae bacterium]